MWQYVIPHFSAFLDNLELTNAQHLDIITKAENIGRCLSRQYYDGQYQRNQLILVGSFGKQVCIRPITDIDMLYILPPSVFGRFNAYTHNGQSALLQEVKQALEVTFPTKIRADGQVVQVFFDTIPFEVVPAFIYRQGTYAICDTNNGGSWRETDPFCEQTVIDNVDRMANNNARPLIKMLKAWKLSCNVDIPSLGLEILACAFLQIWKFKDQGLYYYDWMVRDFFFYIIQQYGEQLRVPNYFADYTSFEYLDIGTNWLSKAVSAYQISIKACDYERDDYWILAEDEWKKVFGDQFVRYLSNRSSLIGG
jgi:hypothetical protein